MASYFDLTVGQEQQFRVALSKGGMTAELVEAVGNDDVLGQVMVDALKTYLKGMGESKTTFVAPDLYVQPSYEELTRRFQGVAPDYRSYRFYPIERCKDVSRENREVTFELVHLDRGATKDEVLAEMDRRGLRPALYEELLRFAEKYPYEQMKYLIVALGSETEYRMSSLLGRPLCNRADLYRVGTRRFLSMNCNTTFDRSTRFLAVRE